MGAKFCLAVNTRSSSLLSSLPSSLFFEAVSGFKIWPRSEHASTVKESCAVLFVAVSEHASTVKESCLSFFFEAVNGSKILPRSEHAFVFSPLLSSLLSSSSPPVSSRSRVEVVLWVSCGGGAVGVVSWWCCGCRVLLLFFRLKEERIQVAGPSRMELPNQASILTYGCMCSTT